jgi:hypothetical protein
MSTVLRFLIVTASFLGMVGCNGSIKRLIPPPAIAPIPLCANPAPLEGKFDPNAPGYFVGLKTQVDFVSNVQELAEQYRFVPQAVYEDFGFFFVELPESTVARIRCEPVVRYVGHNGTTWALGTTPQ